MPRNDRYTKYRVAYFNFVTHFGGMQQANASLCARLARRHDVMVYDPFACCDEHLRAYHDTGVKFTALAPHAKLRTIGFKGQTLKRVIRLLASVPDMVRVSWRLRQQLLTDRPDIVLIASTKAARVLSLAAIGLNIPVLYYLHSFKMADYLVRSHVCENVDGVLTLTDSIRAMVIQQGIPESRVFTCHNAFDSQVLRAKSQRPLEEELPTRSVPARVLLAGSLRPEKGQECAISAVRRCVDAGLNTALYLAGDAPHGQTEQYVSRLRSHVRSLGLGDRVHFLGWRNDIPQMIANATMLILPSLAEGLPLSLMEAMALRCPVASTPVGGVPDLIEHEQTGWLFEVANDQALADCILAAHADSKRTQEIVEKANKHVTTRFSVSRQLELFEQAVAAVTTASSPLGQNL